MGFLIDIPLENGEVCSYHAVHHFAFDDRGGCVASIGAYSDELSALINARPVESFMLRCDGVTPTDDVARQIYCIAAKNPRYAGAVAFSDDAAYGLEHPTDPLPERPEAPSPYHVWSPKAWCWMIDEAGLAMIREAAKQRINEARNKEERNGFEAFGQRFDSDDKSVQRISVAAQAAMFAKAAAQPFASEWTLADNTTIVLDADKMMQLPIIMAMAADAMHQKARSMKSAIDSAATIEEINAIAW